MSYVNGMIQQKESLAASQFFRPSIVESSLADVSRGSGFQRSTNGNQSRDIAPPSEDGSRFLPGSKVDLHILANVDSIHKCVTVEEILSNKRTFLAKLKEQRKTYLIKDLNLLTKNLGELRQVMSSLVAFFIVQHQIQVAYPDPEGKRELLELFQNKTEEHLLSITRFGYSSNEILSVKKLLHFCGHCCKLKNMADEEAAFLESTLT